MFAMLFCCHGIRSVNISKQGGESNRAEELSPMIIDVFWKHRRHYGARRIASDQLAREFCRGV